MKEEELLDKHPGLKRKMFHKDWVKCTKDEVKLLASIQNIHETQIDKIVIEKAIDKLNIVGIMRTKGRMMSSEEFEKIIGVKK